MPRLQTTNRVNLPYEIKRQVEQESGGHCAHCNVPISYADKTFTIEHVVPLHKGGTNDPKNLIGLCAACNRDKGDDIIDPKLYYPHLPKAKKKTVTAYFKHYLETVDCIAYDSIFMTDRFSFTTPWCIFGSRIGDRPAQLKTRGTKSFFVRKLRPEEAAEQLMIYAARLPYEARDLFEFDAQKLTLPYYEILSNDKHYGIISPAIRDIDDIKNTLVCDIMLSQDLGPDTDENCTNWAFMLNGLFDIMQRPFHKYHNGTVITAQFRTPNTDAITKGALAVYSQMDTKHHWEYYIRMPEDAESSDPRNIAYIQTILLNGDPDTLRRMAQGLYNTKSVVKMNEIMTKELHTATSESIQTKLQSAKPIRAERLKPKRKKQKGKRKKH